MKSYPSISTKVDMSQSYWVFDKLDGSNIRAEWSPKRGFYKFGSRTQLLTPSQDSLWPAVARIEEMNKRLGEALSSLKLERAVCFFEWHGPGSFAGSHVDHVDDMLLSLLDIDVYKRGFLAPLTVLEIATSSNIHVPTLIHEGVLSQALLDRVRSGLQSGVTCEGVVGKTAQTRASVPPSVFKHKSQAWYDRLKEMCAGDQAMYDRLR